MEGLNQRFHTNVRIEPLHTNLEKGEGHETGQEVGLNPFFILKIDRLCFELRLQNAQAFLNLPTALIDLEGALYIITTNPSFTLLIFSRKLQNPDSKFQFLFICV